MKLLPLLLLSLISFALHSQDFRKGFIITPQNDTLRGYVSYREGVRAHKVCNFKAAPNQDVIKYDPTQLKGYGFENNAYFASELAQVRDTVYEQAFLEVLAKGRVTLYKYDYFYFLEKDDGKLVRLIVKDIVRKRNGTTYVGRSTLHIGVVRVMLSDCEAVRPLLDKFELNERTLARLVGSYNQCVGGEAVVYKERKPWFKAEIGVLGGVTQSTLKVETDYLWNTYLTSPYQKSTTPVGGISFLFSSPRLNERFGFLGEAQFLKSSYYSYSKVTSGATSANTERNYVSITVSQVRVPIAIRYTFTGKKFTPFLDLGVSSIFHTNSSGSVKTDLQYGQSILLSSALPLQLRNHQTGVWGGVGMVFPIHPRWNGFVEFRYEKTNGIVQGDVRTIGDLTSNVTNLQLILGLRTK